MYDPVAPLLPQILGDGELPFALTIHAESISEGARSKIEAAGGTFVAVAVKPKWTRKLHNRRIREAAAAAAKATAVKK